MSARAITTGVPDLGRLVSLALPGILLGNGLGGFLDGILLHQILQWHHMLSSADTANIPIGSVPVDTVPGLRMNTLFDGFFHTLTWLSVLTGLGILYSRVTAGRRRLWGSRALWGWIIAGWGLFNVVEGLVDYQVLGIHHVISGRYQVAADMGFLALGAALIVGGVLLQRSSPIVEPDGSRGRHR